MLFKFLGFYKPTNKGQTQWVFLVPAIDMGALAPWTNALIFSDHTIIKVRLKLKTSGRGKESG